MSNLLADDDRVRCAGCKQTFDSFHEYEAHGESADCLLTGEDWVRSDG